jgi:ABC-2 type transport system ATP-binding protein
MNDSSPNVIEAAGLTKVFTDFWGRPKVRAVDNISLAVPRGEIFGLLGPNGSGKSTTIKMILGLLRPTAGSLTVLGHPPSDVATKSRMGFMPEESYLYKYLTAPEILMFFANLSGLPTSARQDTVNRLIDQVGLTGAGNRRIGEFSKGMARRVGLAQSLLNDPDLILLDEPTSGLDPVACREVKDLLLALAARGKTILICSHHLADMEDICDRFAILLNGRICTQGTVADMLREPGLLQLTIHGLSSDKLPAVLHYLEQETGHTPVVDHAGQSLESFYVNVVSQRRATP